MEGRDQGEGREISRKSPKGSKSGPQLIEAGIRGLPFYTFLVFQQDWTENDRFWEIFIFIYLGKCAVLLAHAFKTCKKC